MYWNDDPKEAALLVQNLLRKITMNDKTGLYTVETKLSSQEYRAITMANDVLRLYSNGGLVPKQEE